MNRHKFKKSILGLMIMLFLAACSDSGSSVNGNTIPEADSNTTLVSQVPVGDVYSDLTVRDANGSVVGVFDPNTGYITLSDGRVVTMDGNSIFESSSSSSAIVSSSSEKVSSSSVTEIQEKPNWKYLNPYISYGMFQDSRDGQVYKTVKIGDQIWMAENLNYAYLQPTSTEVSSSFCYSNKPDSCAKYGRLYLWSAAMDSAGVFGDGGKGCGYYGKTCSAKESIRGVCPEGWHLPSNAEWWTLIETIGDTSVAGKKLKSANGWYKGDNGTDEYGFSVLPSGFLYDYGAFAKVGEFPHFWTSTEGSSSRTYAWQLYHDIGRAKPYTDIKNYGFSIRCVKDFD
ncbi:fibrobacter succinogenes major paralogous domain-containing protein [Fibrobacter intestinalis]|uniref:Major paralogous domain-containing protein n=1 Tax=Fibrobacter intestinalis TaxID=28122 RepID=A0A1T4M5Z4_9BACT|nr:MULTISPECIES: fibrobacter succinogenes major paralogous domain-containing protein [Fibrobacter]PBC73447.1 uncharacterized protein (TIGR02145 family) [Fibrobacter sp. NR9]SJZ62198.1 major paralogous domain-containing protein [Fibrobacter intestinalis]